MNKNLSFIILSVALLLSACVKDSSDIDIPTTPLEAVTFDAQIGKNTRAGYVGDMTTGILKDVDATSNGFGVFACYTGTSLWSVWKESASSLMNFMYNQQVSWDDTNGYWTYSPVKYWPNGTDAPNAVGAPSNTATETAPQYLSFFAYAPYVEVTPTTGAVTGSDDNGIVAMTGNTTKAEDAYLTYRANATNPFDPVHNVDLLWGVRGAFQYREADGTDNPDPALTALGNSHNIDLTKQTVDEQVEFLFKHALAKFTITVQGLFDHTDNQDTSVEYPDDVDANTRILIERVSFESSPLFKEGNMYLAPRTNDATTPYWKIEGDAAAVAAKKQSLSISGVDINVNLADTYIVDGKDSTFHADFLVDTGTDTEAAKEKFDALPLGVTHTEKPLLAYETFYYRVIPNKDYITETPSDPMKVRMVYWVITYDPQLTLNSPKYYSIVKNDITATFSTTFAFEAGKSYKLRLQPGLTTVKFEVEVGEWDTPITLTPLVVDWQTETVGEYDLDDSNTKDTTP